MISLLEINQANVVIGDQPILFNIDLAIKPGERHVLMGPNGSGKSTLALALAGYPEYRFSKGSAKFCKLDLTKAKPEERARAGLFIALQQPATLEGIKVRNLLRASANAIRTAQGMPPLSIRALRTEACEALKKVGLPIEFLDRFVNEGFSGGEKKRFEIAQFLLLKPKLAILDEVDSGLDVDAIQLVSQTISENSDGLLVITHHATLAHLIEPTRVHIMLAGRIVKSGGTELIDHVQANGYAQIN